MDAPQAADHLDLVNATIRRVEQSGHPPALLFIVWGIVGISFNVAGQLFSMGIVDDRAFWVAGGIVVLAIAASVWDIRRMERDAGRKTVVARLAGTTFWSVAAVMAVASLTFTKFFPPFAPAIFFAAGFSSALLALGFGLRSLTMTLGGAALLAALVLASLVPTQLGTILAIGNFVAFVVPGILFAVRKTDG